MFVNLLNLMLKNKITSQPWQYTLVFRCGESFAMKIKGGRRSIFAMFISMGGIKFTYFLKIYQKKKKIKNFFNFF